MERVLRIGERLLTGLLLAVLMLWSLIPIVWNFLTSIKQRVDIFTMPPKLFFEPTFQYYATILEPGSGASVYPNLINTIVIALGTMVLSMVVASMAAYAFSRYRFRGRGLLMFGVLATRLLPPISAVVPLFMLLNGLKLIDTHLVLILIYSALSVPFSIWLLKSFFDTVPRELEESALLDGCTRMQALWRITLPLAAPGLVATAVFILIVAWNEFMFAFMFTSVEARTLPVLISEARGDDQFFWQDMAAKASILMFLPLLLGLYLQRYLAKGLTAGALK